MRSGSASKQSEFGRRRQRGGESGGEGGAEGRQGWKWMQAREAGRKNDCESARLAPTRIRLRTAGNKEQERMRAQVFVDWLMDAQFPLRREQEVGCVEVG